MDMVLGKQTEDYLRIRINLKEPLNIKFQFPLYYE